ncbi:NADH dehydrogenase subunit 6 (mitochondrion) [Nanorana parkeri]|uniref:NADH-ubiquinone oxidoreductase chain 6 n=1 Tax=Nanorana parkeri TaxID=125878 RepID=A0A0U1ZIQ4_9NEOB|nr:NADH dehydrogenase subunit 6 [Nanorana parkeri]AJW59698.1 NADH dehydrogenase subunit 6 [Nanorana parkeri]
MKELCLLIGLLGVASNPSPYYGALGLVVGAGAGCFVLAQWGVTFLALVLFLVYLGGMMVVFAYCAALVAEPYPEAWGSRVVAVYLVMYVGLVWMGWAVFGGNEMEIGNEWVRTWWAMKSSEMSGATQMYQAGGKMLTLCGWGLLVTLFVVLEVVRGHKSVSLRSV